VLSLNSLYATHIIGGEINYSCLGNDQYEITLQLFRDCDTGEPWFASPAIIEVLGSNGQFLSTINMNLRNNDTLAFMSSACSVIPDSACIHTTTYREVRTLPFRVGGYQFLYQICCRNVDIVNILSPTTTQAAYHAVLTEEALLACNSAPKFDDWPPFYICNGQVFSYDHSATDVDGDSIVYELCTPYDVFGNSNPFVDWQLPYQVNNMLGGPQPFTIDPVTGLLTGTPFTNGTFVFGICIREYRNGVLFGQIRRDFQFIVTHCITSIIADFEPDIPPCNASLSIAFDNLSYPSNGPFIWDFGDGSLGASTENPIHSFPDTGLYTISLISGLGTPCEDSIEMDVQLNIEAADIDVISAPIICNENKVLLVASNVFSEFNQIVNYTWAPPGNILSGQGTDSVWMAVSGSSFGVWVTATNNYGCTDLVQLTQIDVPIDTVLAVFDSTQFVCNRTLTVPFNNQSFASNNQYLWNFANLASSTDFNPTYTFPDTGTYAITLIAGVGSPCQDTFIRTLYLPLTKPSIAAIGSQTVCQADTLLLTAFEAGQNYHNIIDYTWTPSSNIISGQGTDSIWVLASGDLYFEVVATNTENCKDTNNTSVIVSTISPMFTVSATPDEIYLGQTTDLLASYDVDYVYNWLPDTSLSATDIHDPTANPRSTNTYYVRVGNNYGCSLLDSVTVQILPPLCGNPVVFVPSAFSPDNDGYNDVLMVEGNNITEMTFAIYNRWGQKIFETNDQSRGWDGTFKGALLAPDVYGYYMQCTCDDGSEAFLKGNITLLR
jgi:gliding motility-associated-like protein